MLYVGLTSFLLLVKNIYQLLFTIKKTNEHAQGQREGSRIGGINVLKIFNSCIHNKKLASEGG